MNHRQYIFIYLSLIMVGCAGYVDQTARMRTQMREGNPERALTEIDQQLGIEKLTDDPDMNSKNATLLMLERATLLQSLERHEAAAKTFQAVDDQLEVLDLTQDNLGQVSKYLYSDDASVYKSPPFEKLLLNPLNLINYLLMDKPAGAKIEARRFEINRTFFRDQNRSDPAVERFGSYLAGIAFEQAGEYQRAMRFYADAFEESTAKHIEHTIKSLHRRTGASDPRVRKLLTRESTTHERVIDNDTGEVIILVQEGLVPRRKATRLPIGLAITRIQGDPYYQNQLTPKQRARAQRIAAKGLVTWVNFPTMEVEARTTAPIQIRIDGQLHASNLLLNVQSAALKYFKKHEGLILVAAVARTISRAFIASAAEGLSQDAGSGGPGAFLIGLLLQGTMTAADTPDTRGWVSLPARIYHVRKSLPVGPHSITVTVGQRTFKKTVNIRKSQLTVINFSRHRAGSY